jgi:hypothetical protein
VLKALVASYFSGSQPEGFHSCVLWFFGAPLEMKVFYEFF